MNPDGINNPMLVGVTSLVVAFIFLSIGASIRRASKKAEREGVPFDSLQLLNNFIKHQFGLFALITFGLMLAETVILTDLAADDRNPAGVFLIHGGINIAMFVLGINFPKNSLAFAKATITGIKQMYFSSRSKDKKFKAKLDKMPEKITMSQYLAITGFTFACVYAAIIAPMEILEMMARGYGAYDYLELYYYEWRTPKEVYEAYYASVAFQSHPLYIEHGQFSTVDEIMHGGLDTSIFLVQWHFLLAFLKGCAVVGYGQNTLLDDFAQQLTGDQIITHKKSFSDFEKDPNIRSDFFESLLKKCGMVEPGLSTQLGRIVNSYDKMTKGKNRVYTALKVQLEEIKTIDKAYSKGKLSKSDYESKLKNHKQEVKKVIGASSKHGKGLGVSISIK